MKNTMIKLLSVLLLVTLLAGGSILSAHAAEAFTVDGSVIFEKDGLKVTTAGLDKDPSSGDDDSIIWVDIENKGEKDTWLGIEDGTVNGFLTSVWLASYRQEDGGWYSANYDFRLNIPAGSTGSYALAYAVQTVPGLDMKKLCDMEFCFTLAKDEFALADYRSEPVAITTGEAAQTLDLDTLGTVVLDDDKVKLVIGEQDYDDWFGPYINVYAENKTDHYVGISGNSAELDGTKCENLLGGMAMVPGKRIASSFMFEDLDSGMKSFEKLTLRLSRYESEDPYKMNEAESVPLDPVSVTFHPQPWGEYENGGLSMEIQPKYNELVTVETPAESERGMLFSVYENASREAENYDGAGWLFGIGTVSAERLHEMLCQDMSGAQVFAKDGEGRYYMYYHPTDVRYARATVEEMKRDQAQWRALTEWAAGMPDRIAKLNGLEPVSYGNSEVDIYLARAAWMDGEKHTLSTTEFGPVDIKDVDGTLYAEKLMQCWYEMLPDTEAPDGQYVVLGFPEMEETRVDFFFAPGNFVRVVNGEREMLYQACAAEGETDVTNTMQRWYYAAAEKAGLKPVDAAAANG